MFTNSDKKWLKETFATKDNLRNLAKQDDLLAVKQDLTTVKSDVRTIKEDIIDMKIKLNDFASTMLDAVGNIIDWTQDTHKSLVKEKLPERVQKIEQILKTS